ncbi:hypothetical protein [Oceanobacillus picturae]|uniref:hypothetical protein n=1 Tax=Oceanobacillus picturae TaxID=171693 RepID=UPI000E684EC8|nr:hypothetical protein [Oceanobacillus picturae]RIU93312.1 hypothetical protein D1864_07515 [Oceanobacillus picturae]
MTKNISIQDIALLETGEKLEQVGVIYNPDDYNVINKKSEARKKAYLLSRKEKSEFDALAGRFTFTLASTIIKLNNDKRFSQTEKTRIMYLGTYVSYQEKGSYLMHCNGKYVLKNKLQSLLEMTNKVEFYKFYNKLLLAGIIQEEKLNKSTIKIMWSSEYNFRGKASPEALKEKNLIKTYDNQIRELYHEKDSKGKKVHTANNLYTLFMLMPYVQPESNMICLHPENETDSCPLTIKDLAEIFNYNRTNDLKRKLFKIKLRGMPVFATISNSNYTHIVVNPFIVYRSNKAPSDALLIHFKDTAKRTSKK